VRGDLVRGHCEETPFAFAKKNGADTAISTSSFYIPCSIFYIHHPSSVLCLLSSAFRVAASSAACGRRGAQPGGMASPWSSRAQHYRPVIPSEAEESIKKTSPHCSFSRRRHGDAICPLSSVLCFLSSVFCPLFSVLCLPSHVIARSAASLPSAQPKGSNPSMFKKLSDGSLESKTPRHLVRAF